MIFIISDLAFHDMIESRFAIVGKVQHVKHVFFLLLDHLPTIVDDVLES